MAKEGFFASLTERRAEAENDGVEIRRALARWKDAVRYFENVSDPDLVDFAAYDMEAAKRKYVFLLKRGERRPTRTM